MDQYSQFYQNTNANNRVYINRNFNRYGLDAVSTCTNNNVMYFNPNFAHTSSSHHNIPLQRVDTIRPRIHVNPNFIRPKVHDVTAYGAQISSSSMLGIPRTATTYTQPTTCSQQMQVNVIQKRPQIATVSKSRYCLVRENENVKPAIVNAVPCKSTQQTVKLSKYKLVSLNSVKKSLITDKAPTAKLIIPTQIKWNQTNAIKTKYRISLKGTSNNVQNTRYKYVRRNSLLKPTESAQGTVKRISITHNKSILRTSFRQTKKIVRGALKKNNIPCPLFKKYGKCLRMIQGNCDYLHDRKHVSICRKFIKGACHDKNCLLSHDLTDKKMPTCYFYLQGTCTKEECPYLHVKLNEKAKICPDFLKGYCEKGDKCVFRHVNVVSKKLSILVKPKKHNSSAINTRTHIEKTKICKKNTENEEGKTSSVVTNNQESNNDQRYFREVAVSDNTTVEEQCDLIKPTRCKLGTLPSFIQL